MLATDRSLIDEVSRYREACVFSLGVLRHALRYPDELDQIENIKLCIYDARDLLKAAIEEGKTDSDEGC